MRLRNHDVTKSRIKTTRNHRVYKSPYYCGVQLWERLPVAVQTEVNKSIFNKNINEFIV